MMIGLMKLVPSPADWSASRELSSVKAGVVKACHPPVLSMSSLGRNDVTSSPNVGSVHATARITAIRDAHGEVSFCFALLLAVSTRAMLGVLVTGRISSPVAAVIYLPSEARSWRTL